MVNEKKRGEETESETTRVRVVTEGIYRPDRSDWKGREERRGEKVKVLHGLSVINEWTTLRLLK